MRSTSHLDSEDRDRPCEVSGGGPPDSQAPFHLVRILLGLVFMLNSFLVDWLLADQSPVAAGSALIGAVILGVPIIAAVFHVSGSLLVVFNSFRLIRQGEDDEPLASNRGVGGEASSTATRSFPSPDFVRDRSGEQIGKVCASGTKNRGSLAVYSQIRPAS